MLSYMIEEEKNRPAQPLLGFCGVAEILRGETMWQSRVNPIDVLACADTVEDIIPKNKMSRYLKTKYETDSYQCDTYEDESTLNTLNTTGDTIDQTVDQTIDQTVDQTVDQTIDQSIDPTIDQMIDQPIEHSLDDSLGKILDLPFDESLDQAIETLRSDVDGTVEISAVASLAATDCRENSSLLLKPVYSSPLRKFNIELNGSGSEDLDTTVNTTVNTTMESATSLKFAPWIGEDGKREKKHRDPSPAPPSPSRSNSSDNDDATKISKISEHTSGASKEGGETTCSNNSGATSQSIEVIGRSIKKEEKKKKKKKFRARISSKGKTNKEKEMSEQTMKDKREGRWEEMKAILQATADIENSGKKKGTWKKTVKGAIGSKKK